MNIPKTLARLPFASGIRRAMVIRTEARRLMQGWAEAEEQMLHFYGKFLRAKDLCFDIGANLGGRVKIFRRCGCRVIAVEPQRECVRELRRWFGKDDLVTVIPCAIGAERATATLRTCNFHRISSLSNEWIAATLASGRFASQHWTRGRKVELVTLDDLIAKFGVPRFVKIDVEGFEFEALKGLSTPVPYLSFEFTPESIELALGCLAQISRLGKAQFNFSPGESMRLTFEQWISEEAMAEHLSILAVERDNWGDIYAVFEGEEVDQPR